MAEPNTPQYTAGRHGVGYLVAEDSTTTTLPAITSTPIIETTSSIVTCQPQSSRIDTQPLCIVSTTSFENPTYEGPQELSVLDLETSQDDAAPGPVRQIPHHGNISVQK